MRLTIAAIGKLRSNDPKAILIDDYVSRIEKTGRGLGFSGMTIKTFEPPRGMTGKACQARETALLLDAIPDNATLLVMDEKGDNLTSMAFARLLETYLERGMTQAVFAIGGADGHTDELRQRASKTIAFGKATWPHMLARLMLCEQLYRAMTIISGHPYHRV